MKLSALFLCFLSVVGCATATSHGDASLIPRATQFMESYAQDLSKGDSASLATRYHPQGAYFLGNGLKSLETHEAIATRYRDHWHQPVAFEWQDLSYEPIGSAGILVLGKFKWSTPDGRVVLCSYSGLLVKVNGQLKIRAEDESFAKN